MPRNDVYKHLNALSQKHEIEAELGGDSYRAHVTRLMNDHDVSCMQALDRSKQYSIGEIWIIHVAWDHHMDCTEATVIKHSAYRQELDKLVGGFEQAEFLLTDTEHNKQVPETGKDT